MKNLQGISHVVLLAFISFAISFTSCKKDENDLPSNPVQPSGTTLKTTIVGKITETGNSMVSGVTVKLGSQTTVTDLRGHFLFVNADVPKDRIVLKASKQGYFDCIIGKRTQEGGVNYVNMVLQELPAVVSVSAVAGGVVNIPGGARITFPANAFVDAGGNVYTGTVKVYARHFNPADDGFAAIIPGGDLIGKNTLGEDVALYPMGMIEALLWDNSGVNEIKLAAGVTAQLRMPIDPSQNAMAQSTVPLWHLDESNGIWKEEGQAVKNGNFFEGNVSHFSTWNCDYQGPRADIVGKVVDCQGVPVAGVVVTINGWLNVNTDNNGEYTTWVPVGMAITCQVLTQFNPMVISNSLPQTITSVGGQINIIPDLITPCLGRVAGSIVNCITNQKSQAFVFISWNGGYAYQYSTDGEYSIEVPAFTSVNVFANDLSYAGSSSTTSGPPASTTVIPDISLCPGNYGNMNGFKLASATDTTYYDINVISTISDFVDQNNDGIYDSVYININGITVQDALPVNIIIKLNNSLNGLHYPIASGNSIDIFLYQQTGTLFLHSNSTGTPGSANAINFLEFGVPGGKVFGLFEYYSHSSVYHITEGKFEFIRYN